MGAEARALTDQEHRVAPVVAEVEMLVTKREEQQELLDRVTVVGGQEEVVGPQREAAAVPASLDTMVVRMAVRGQVLTATVVMASLVLYRAARYSMAAAEPEHGKREVLNLPEEMAVEEMPVAMELVVAAE